VPTPFAVATRVIALQLGDKRTGRISYADVDAYLSVHRLRWDRGLLMAMFLEADHKRQCSLTARDLIGTLSGRAA
jgi:hypothetical protein